MPEYGKSRGTSGSRGCRWPGRRALAASACAVGAGRQRRMQYRTGLLDNLLANTGLDLGNLRNW